MLVLPYAYRALDAGLAAIDVKTLSEAARSLGRGWFTVMLRVIVPNISQALLNAALLSVALVLGEFTIASLLLYTNLQVELVHQLGRANAGVSIAVAVASLLFAFVLLVVLSFVGRRRRRGPRERRDWRRSDGGYAEMARRGRRGRGTPRGPAPQVRRGHRARRAST